MAKKKTHPYRGLPMAPSKVEERLARRLRRWGRIDAKQYENLRDYTRTHAVIWMDEIAKTGQSEVNLWYTTQCEPLLAGNERIHVEIELLENQIEACEMRDDKTLRERARTAREISRLKHDVMNFEAQRRTNISRGLTFRRHADEALTSWETYRAMMASIYTRARANRSDSEVASSRAEVPAYEPIDLPIIPQLEDETLGDFAPEPRASSPRSRPSDAGRTRPRPSTGARAGSSAGRDSDDLDGVALAGVGR